MRFVLLTLAALLAAGCAERDEESRPSASTAEAEFTSGEHRARIAPRGEAAALLRSGRRVPLELPRGFTLYPGARVIANSLVERGGRRRALLVFETRDPLEKVMLFYRAQAREARAHVSFDLGGEDRASLGGVAADGRSFTVAGRRLEAGAHVEFSLD